MTNWDAWTDFERALTGQLRKAPAGSFIDLILFHTPHGMDSAALIDLGIIIGRNVIKAVFKTTTKTTPPLSSAQTNALRDLGWWKEGSYWLWRASPDDDLLLTGTSSPTPWTLRSLRRTFSYEGYMEDRVAQAVVQVMTYVVGAETPGRVRVHLTPPDGERQSLRREEMVPPAAPVMLDTTGLQRDRRYFVDPSTGGTMSLDIIDRALREPYWLNDLGLARRKLARDYAQIGCLIEANPITVGGVRGMTQLWKQSAPDHRHGFLFGVSVWLAKTTQTVAIMYSMDEARRESTSSREVWVAVMLQNHDHAVQEPHPYDPELHGRLPFSRSDDEVWDEQFPGHPLTCVRAWLRGLDQIVTVDPAFAALPDFRGTTRQPEGRLRGGFQAVVGRRGDRWPVQSPGYS
jgi:hypothetical protein